MTRERAFELENFLIGLRDQDEDHADEYNELIELVWRMESLEK